MRQSDLRPYQQRIATHLYEHDEALCVLRPGGGKTAAALTAIVDLLRDGVIRHALIVAPKRVARVVWPDEISQWAHARGLVHEVLSGTPARRAATLANAGQRQITIIGMDIIPWLIETLDDYRDDHPLFDLLILDEISRLRNPTGVRSKAIGKAGKRWRMIWGLTGILRPNSALDLFMPSRIVTRGKLWGRSFYKWREQYFRSTDFMGYKWEPMPGAEDKLNEAIAPLMVMVNENEMPTVTPTIVFDYVDLPLHARTQYDDMRKLLMTRTSDETIVADSAAIATGKLAQLANGFIYGDNAVDNVNINRIHDEKRVAAGHPRREHRPDAADLRVYRGPADVVEELGDDLPIIGGGASDTVTTRNIERWNKGELKFMALHPAAGGHDLNLQFGAATWPGYLLHGRRKCGEDNRAPGQAGPGIRSWCACVARDTVDGSSSTASTTR
jgi:hypothetical protein